MKLSEFKKLSLEGMLVAWPKLFLPRECKSINDDDRPLFPRIFCKNGVHLSVQVGYGNYCYPRNGHSDYYYSAEVGFPSIKPDMMMQYAEYEEAPTDTVYSYVPIKIIDQFIESQGGIDLDKTFSNLTKERFYYEFKNGVIDE